MRSAVIGGLASGLLLGGCAAPAPLRPVGTLPLYAHNDYRNDRPLAGALALGFSGVEADVFLVDVQLLVAHDRRDVRPERTLRKLYLDPLRQLVGANGWVRPDGKAFLLNIELKESDPASFLALHELLLGYDDVLTGVVGGRVQARAVQVVLVGHHPTLAELVALPNRCFAVQSYVRDLPAPEAEVPAHLLQLVTARYADHFAWDGRGEVPSQFWATAAGLVAARDAVPGRMLRVFKVPRRASVYQALRTAGVDLIGSENPAASARLMNGN